ncbi:MAG: McrC family protein [Oribacterium sp.]|nr:McrC family protein [Oribacterium sp.]
MRRFLEVREFDTIMHNRSYAEDYPYLDEKDFHDLERFIHEFAGEADTADALEFMRIGHRRGIGDTISVNNYVGLIQTRLGCQIQVLPKIAFADENGDQTKKVFLRMLRSMKEFSGKEFSKADLKEDRMNLYEIFISMYVTEVIGLVKKGLKSAYIGQEDNLAVFKGKLKVLENIQRNLSHHERFYVAYDEFVVNRAENRIVKATLEKLLRISADEENIRNIRRLLSAFEQVHASVNYDKDFSQIVLDRSTKYYEDILKWSKIFLKNRSFTTFSGNTVARAILFPMEKIFESYVAMELRKYIDPAWTLEAQKQGMFLFDEPEKFSLRPDIVITRDDGTRVILDTKWKKLNDSSSKNYGISQADMYQMFAYAERFETPNIWLLYPATETMKGDVGISYVSSAQNGHMAARVRVFFVDVVNIGESLKTLVQLIHGNISYGYEALE